MISSRTVRQSTCLVLAGVLLFTGITAAARGKPDPEEHAFFTIAITASAVPGDTIPVVLHSSREIPETVITILSGEDTVIGSATTFPLETAPDAGYRAGALIPLNSLIAPGTYRIEIPAESEILIRTLDIHPRDFTAEEIALTEENTAIKTDTSKERMEQIKKLSAILLTRSDDAPVFNGPFILPVNATRRTSGYGDRRMYKFAQGGSQRNIHYGIDFGIPEGTPVFSSGDGRVVLAEFRITTGWTIVVEHLPGVYSLYYHLSALDTARGEIVRAGTLIGKSGCTGLSTGPHLHWEFRVNGEAVDPDWFVGRTLF